MATSAQGGVIADAPLSTRLLVELSVARVVRPVTPRVPPTVALFVTARPVPAAVALTAPENVALVAVMAPVTPRVPPTVALPVIVAEANVGAPEKVGDPAKVPVNVPPPASVAAPVTFSVPPTTAAPVVAIVENVDGRPAFRICWT